MSEATDSQYLRSLPYYKFLKTDYWKKVRSIVLERDRFLCQECFGKDRLEVHHRTYEHHGHEHEHLQDLITLCRNCHGRQHGLSEILSPSSRLIPVSDILFNLPVVHTWMSTRHPDVKLRDLLQQYRVPRTED